MRAVTVDQLTRRRTVLERKHARDQILLLATHVREQQAPMVADGPVLPVVPLPLYVLLKLVSFDDRRAPKDVGVFHSLRYYLDDDDRRYLAEHAGTGVPFEYAGAYWLGADGQLFLSDPLACVLSRVLGRLAHPDADGVGTVARERGRYAIDGEERTDIFERFGGTDSVPTSTSEGRPRLEKLAGLTVTRCRATQRRGEDPTGRATAGQLTAHLGSWCMSV